MEKINSLLLSFIDYLIKHEDVMISLVMWTVTNTGMAIMLLRTEKRRIEGSKGLNGIWESPEQITHILSWLLTPTITFAIFFKVPSVEGYAWAILGGGLAYAIGGRWIFEWALAFKNGGKVVDEPVKVTTTTETTVK